jgi:hypothetical protein
MTETKIYLSPDQLGDSERLLVEQDGLSASVFRYASGVCGLHLRNELGELALLPFQGQQIWSAKFGGRELAMQSMFSEPRPTREYLETYGALLLHCGATAMGVPGPQDKHPLHGELPNAPYQKAWVVLGEDEAGSYIGLGGQYQHTVAFNHNYLAEPLVKLHHNSSLFWIIMNIHNLKHSNMELMYLAHINLRPVDHGRLVYSAPYDAQHVRVRTSIPSHIRPGPGYVEFIESLKQHPQEHNHFVPGQVFDPEIVFYLDYQADEDGWAHSLQVRPDGSADYVRHAPAQLDKVIRWIVRTDDQQALGLALPATAEPEGYLAEKAKGNLKILPAGGRFTCQMQAGWLNPAQTAQVEAKINQIKK